MPAIDTQAKGEDLAEQVSKLVCETEQLSKRYAELKEDMCFEPIVYDYVKKQLALNFRALDAISLIMGGLLNETV